MKKWSYAAAMMLAISSGCIFTGCIDNDEPYGIEQIRVATASLLEAKKAAVEAEAAAANADLEIEKIKAEISKLEAENQKILNESQAKINEAEAQAKLLAAQAEAAKTQAEADKLKAEAAQYQAQADQVKAATEAYIKDQEASLNEKIALAEINVNTAQLKYDKAVYNFEQKKATNAENANDALWQAVESAFGSYLWNLDAYNAAVKEHLDAVRKLAALNLDLVWIKGDDNKWQFVSPAYDQKASLENMKAQLERTWAAEQKTIDLYEGLVAALDEVKESEMYSLLEKYQADLEAAELDYQKANAELELVENDPANKEIFDKEDEIQNQIDALKEEEIEIPGWTYEPIPQLHVLGNAWDKSYDVVEAGQKYSLKDQVNYDAAKAEYENAIREIKSVTFDENDQAWSDARIKELKRNIPVRAAQATFSWNMAKAVYNNGDKVTAEIAQKAPNGEAVQTTANAFNATIAPLAAARDAYYAAEEAYNRAAAQYSQYGNQQAQDRYYAWEGAKDTWRIAQDTWNTAQDAWKAVDVAGADKESQAYKDAETAYKDAETAYKDAETAYKDAEKKYKPYEDAYNAAANDLYGVEDKDGVRQGGKKQAYYDAVQNSDNALTAFNNAVNKQLDDINQYKPTDPNNPGQKLTYSFEKDPNTNLSTELYNYANDRSEDKSVKAPVAEIPFVQEYNSIYVNAKEYIIFASRYTFGNFEAFDNTDPNGPVDWDKDLAILLPINFANPTSDPATTTKILNLFNGYLERMNPNDGPWDYKDDYSKYFGAYAEVLYNLYSLQIGEAYLNNDLNAALQEVLETPEKNLEDMIAAYEEQDQKLKDLQAQKKEATDAAAALKTAATENEQNAKKYRDALKNVVESLETAVSTMETNAAEPFNENNLAVKNLKSLAEANAEAAKEAQAVLNEQIAAIEYQIEKYGDSENGYASLENPYSYYVAYLETKVENAKSLMEFAKARYDELQAKYDAANK